MRRTIRLGLWLGLLGGIALAVAKVVQLRREPEAGPEPWRPPAPSGKVDPTPNVSGKVDPAPGAVDDVAPAVIQSEPVEPTPAPAPPPAKKAVAKKAGAAKKAPATKKAAATKAPAAKKTPAKKVAGAAKKAAGAAKRIWVEPMGSTCPQTHPVKGKLSTRIYHLPGMWAYDRTRPERCYDSEESARADGLTKSKR